MRSRSVFEKHVFYQQSIRSLVHTFAEQKDKRVDYKDDKSVNAVYRESEWLRHLNLALALVLIP